ncbi:MAG: HIT domain-containing protein [Puniceicoccales bacterium]|jgi:histidine triad (HIT) family protein|nr:HIT domain-containing protein [Puniceicoccales bacterium]
MEEELVATLFEKIANGELSAEFLHRDELCFVIRDIAPLAPLHLLIIPEKPLKNLLSVDLADVFLLGHLLQVASEVARKFGDGRGFRVVINSGDAAGQAVPHLHLHVLGGKNLDHSFG